MCSRYELNLRPDELARRFELTLPPPPGPYPREVRPNDRVPVVLKGHRPALLSWGLPESWDGRPLINARVETLGERRTFRPLLKSRCLVPATAYFEWRRDGRARLKNRIGTDGVLAFAGLVAGDSFTIVTCGTTASIAHVHDRMPVILTAAAEARWLDAALPFSAVAGLLVPYAAGDLNAVEEAPRGRQPDLFGGA